LSESSPVLRRDDASVESAAPSETEEARRSRRLLCVYQHAPTPGAPGIYRHRRYFAELVRRGWEVDLVSTPRNYMTGTVPEAYRRRPVSRETIEGITHHWVWAPGGIHRSRVARAINYAGFAGAAAARSLTVPRPDVVLVSSPPLPVAGLGPLLARRFGCPWLLEVRDVWPESAVSVGWLNPESRLYRLLERFARSITRRAPVVIVPTPGLEPLVRAHGAREVRMLPGIVVPSTPDPERRRLVRSRLGIEDDECLFLYLGAIGAANGLGMLLDAVELLPLAVRARVLVVGDGSARRSFAEAVGARRLRRITLLPPVEQDGVSDLLGAADVGLHLLRPDPIFASALPTKALEYLGAGLPFLTTVPGLPSEVAAASGGTAVSSAPELARELAVWTQAGPDGRRARGERALRYGLDHFGLERSVCRFEELLDEVLARQRRLAGGEQATQS
jgi:glycosyltransferase involved in cell wall biosynthesis